MRTTYSAVLISAFCSSIAASIACSSGTEDPQTGSGGSGGAPGSADSGAAGGMPGNADSGSAGDAPTADAGATGSEHSGGSESMGGNGGDTSVGGAQATSGGGAGGEGPQPVAPSTCSEDVLRTAAPAGKEKFNAPPVDERFPFSLHWMGDMPFEPIYLSTTSLTDIDLDGDLDFASGQRHNGGNNGVFWWEYCAPDHWVRHFIGKGHETAAGGNAMDVDGDGWMDILAGNSWYRNPQTPRTTENWERFFIGSSGSEELIVGDIGGDERPEVLYVWFQHNPEFYRPGADPTQPWERTVLSQNNQQQGGAIGDIDGDGDNDWLVGLRWWYRNVDGDGNEWETMNIFGTEHNSRYNSPLTYLGDIDGDGDLDIALVEHFGSGVAWAENMGGAATEFTFHELATDKDFLHTVVLADFDNDGDLDLFTGQNRGPSYIFENNGMGEFTERLIVSDANLHEARVGDVDCDGDLDITGKPWGDPGEGGDSTEDRDHVYLKNELVENGGTPKFERGIAEQHHTLSGQTRICPTN